MKGLMTCLMMGCVTGWAAAAAPGEAADESSSTPAVEITAKEKRESIVPGTSGDALAEGGKIDVKAEKDTLTVLMTGTAAAHCFVGCHSAGIQTFDLVQDFEVTSTDPEVRDVVLSLESTLNGY